ncbi:dTDP-4-amino-4,6-dideoxy-D-glucose transaminase [anaerobic digester metagenome]
MDKEITVTSPLLPPLEEFNSLLADIWERKWITNNGYYHKELELALCNYLKVPYISLFTNGTLPLIVALQALRITGEVITTPYSFVATTHSLWWNGVKPVFVDIDPQTGNIDTKKVEAAITPRTTAIMPVHVYGNPCNIVDIEIIAKKYGLKIIYDAAHAFGVEVDGKSILNSGDISTLSFHATKTFNTIEGGALICHSKEMKERIDFLKNFGFAGETNVIAPGINGKMDELRAAYGLLQLKYVDGAIQKRKSIANLYRSRLSNIDGISLISELDGVKYNYSYFPIFVDSERFGMDRDSLYFKMKSHGILGRRYFYPLISEFSTYKGLESSRIDNLPVAHRFASNVICLPLHHELEEVDVNRIISVITQ